MWTNPDEARVAIPHEKKRHTLAEDTVVELRQPGTFSEDLALRLRKARGLMSVSCHVVPAANVALA